MILLFTTDAPITSNSTSLSKLLENATPASASQQLNSLKDADQDSEKKRVHFGTNITHTLINTNENKRYGRNRRNVVLPKEGIALEFLFLSLKKRFDSVNIKSKSDHTTINYALSEIFEQRRYDLLTPQCLIYAMYYGSRSDIKSLAYHIYENECTHASPWREADVGGNTPLHILVQRIINPDDRMIEFSQVKDLLYLFSGYYTYHNSHHIRPVDLAREGIHLPLITYLEDLDKNAEPNPYEIQNSYEGSYYDYGQEYFGGC